ncbi:hypothetical protein L4D13_06410 [Photobacterium profundum]|uniref:hypothetical protein n=1 Tax=Photobacterium profundum TaxID=74109 RepID=UPI003D119C5E
MNNQLTIIRSLDPYHQRAGYLAALSLCMQRGLDTKEAVRSRLKDMVWKPLYFDDERLSRAFLNISPHRRKMLDTLVLRRKLEEHPAAILNPESNSSCFIFASELWLHQDCMRSPIGFIPENHVDRILDLARWTGIMSSTIELTEVGYILQVLLFQEQKKEPILFNPLDIYHRPAIRLLLLRLLLGAEVLWPVLLRELISAEDKGIALSSRGKSGLLAIALEYFLSRYSELSDPADILEIREVIDFRNTVLAKDKTQENYLRPRLEILVDLGLIDRLPPKSKKGGRFSWVTTLLSRRLDEVWSDLSSDCTAIPHFLEDQFFSSMAYVYATEATKVKDNRIVLLWFARAYELVGREIGFTPGRTISLLACLLAFEEGRVLELSQVFDTVYAASTTEWDQYFRFSGGSRFDREFMISVDDGLLVELEKNLANNPEIIV